MASAASTSRTPAAWPAPEPEAGASLLLAFAPPAGSPAAVPQRRTVLVVGAGRLASVRTFACLEAGLRVAVLAPTAAIDAELQARISSGQVEQLEWPACLDSQHCKHDEQHNWTEYMQQELPVHVLDDLLLVCVTDTISSTSATTSAPSTRSPASALALRSAFFKLRIPVNVADYPALSDFHFPATYRFPLSEPTPIATTSSSSSSSSLSQQTASPLQIAITTNGNSCRLASRIRREIVTKLPKSVGSAVAKIGQLRAEARRVDRERHARDAHHRMQKDDALHLDDFEQGEREEGWSATQLNKPVPQILASASSSRCTSLNRTKKRPFLAPCDIATGKPLHPSQMPLTPPATPPAHLSQLEAFLSSNDAAAEEIVPPSLTRMRFIAQISEYWPIDRLAGLTEVEGKRVISLYSKEGDHQRPAQQSLSSASGQTGQTLSSNNTGQNSAATASTSASITQLHGSESDDFVAPRHELSLASTSTAAAPPPAKGKIFLLGSGPGSPALLTMAAHTLLTKHATLILSDKLVPSEILALIPPSIPLVIAKKFPGNAEGAQNELMDLAHQGALRGETVVRLKQGDPYVYGRGGEEVLFFRERGFEAVVVPGISSAFAAPLMAGIPVTQRGVSESVTVTTGVGRKGKGVTLPGYERSRTLTVLMGVARLEGVVTALTSASGQEGNGREGGGRQGAPYPPYCPIAIIEKASSPDQRMVASTLEGIVDALERAGDQRPPGMMIIGWSVLALEGRGDVQVLDGVEGMTEAELEQVDRQRVARWLDESRSIVREGLDSSWSDLVALQDTPTIVH